jgi:hypothetical protein
LDAPRLVRIPPLRRADPAAGQPPRLTVLLPALQADRLTGGPNTALNLAARLLVEGIRVRFVSTVEPADVDLARVRAQIGELAGSPAAGGAVELVDATLVGLDVEPADVLLATWWPTAHVALAALSLTAATEFIYLIQDYEPAFYPWSTNHALADATYGFPHRAIFNERLLEGWFAARPPGGRVDAIAFEPAVDRAHFHPPGRGERGRPHRLLFYARPQAERNAFELGLRALRLAAASGAFPADRWSAATVGAPLPNLDLGGGLTMANLPWQPLDGWAASLRRSALLLSLMISPHTSYPPLEMAACGGLVVTNTFESKTATALAAISPRIHGVPAEPEALAAALARCARSVEDGSAGDAQEGDAGSPIGLPGSWDDAFREVVPWLIRGVRQLSGSP